MNATTLGISSHNIRGYRSSKEFLYDRCEENQLKIQCLQEHWLPPPFKRQAGVNTLRSLHPNFEGYGQSAMKAGMEKGIRRGRGFGGTGFLYPKNLTHYIKPLVKFKHERVTVLELKCEPTDTVLINAYFPFLDRSDLQNALAQYSSLLGFIDYIFDELKGANFILLGDFNCNYYDYNHPFHGLLKNFIDKHGLISTFDYSTTFQSGQSFTRHDARSTSLLDFIFISPNLLPQLGCVKIGQYHDNLSDHLPVEIELNIELSFGTASVSSHPVSNIIWSKLSTEELSDFSETMETALDLIDIPPCLLHGGCLCFDVSHNCQIEYYFNRILTAIEAADATLPRTCFKARKPFWSPELSEAKRKSYMCHRIWLEQNKPVSGPIYDDYILSRDSYRSLLRREKKNCMENENGKLYESLARKNHVQFWRSWKQLSQSKDPLSVRIDGHVNDNDIADHFSDVFHDIYANNDAVSHQNLKAEFFSLFPSYFNSHVGDDISQFYFSCADMLDMVKTLKLGKSYAGIVRVEHIRHGSPKLLFHLHLLFNSMMQHGYLPSYFLRGSITPLIKDRDGDNGDSSNYRGITLSSIFIQMFETLEKAKFGYFLTSDDRQFGFKAGVSANHAIFSLKRTVDYFTENNSRVYLGFLDCSKAFDRISHWGLFVKLIRRNVPLCFLLLVMYLYLNMSCTVKWNATHSKVFDVDTGTKQGGILSPDFFSLYINDLISLLVKSGFGCHMIALSIACLFYADDIVLLSPSRAGLQKMLDICYQYCSKYCLDFNVSKSKIMIIGNDLSGGLFAPLSINGRQLDYVSEFKYLGVHLRNKGGLSFSALPEILSFHRSWNSIANGRSRPSKDILLRILYTNCVPVLTYACAVKEFSASEMNSCHVAINNAIRNIFSFDIWQSVRQIRETRGYKSIYEIFQVANTKFSRDMFSSSNHITNHIANCDLS